MSLFIKRSATTTTTTTMRPLFNVAVNVPSRPGHGMVAAGGCWEFCLRSFTAGLFPLWKSRMGTSSDKVGLDFWTFLINMEKFQCTHQISVFFFIVC